MAAARQITGIDCGQPFGLAAARAVEVRAEEVFEHSAAVLDLGQTERLHDMRVATRRLRAALEIFEPCFPAKRRRRALKRVKALADALGERRDRDVAIAFLESLVPELPSADRGRLTAQIGALRLEQRRANEELAPFVEQQRLEKLRRRMRKLVEAARG